MRQAFRMPYLPCPVCRLRIGSACDLVPRTASSVRDMDYDLSKETRDPPALRASEEQMGKILRKPEGLSPLSLWLPPR